MKDRTVPPWLAKQMVADEDALSGSGKLVFTEHEGKTVFGGVAAPNISTYSDGQWHMSVGTLIWVPCKNFIWKDGLCGWGIEDLITSGGMKMENWQEEA